MDNSLAFLLGLTAGVTITLLLVNKKSENQTNDDPTGAIKKEIFEKLEAIIDDIKKH